MTQQTPTSYSTPYEEGMAALDYYGKRADKPLTQTQHRLLNAAKLELAQRYGKWL